MSDRSPCDVPFFTSSREPPVNPSTDFIRRSKTTGGWGADPWLEPRGGSQHAHSG
jgi:hypothetical protein